MRALVLAIAMIAAFASEGRTSGAYGSSVTTPTYRYSFEENMRKSFIDADSARSYMEAHDREMKVRFLAIQAKAEKAIASAKKAGTPIGAYDPLLPALRLKKPTDIKTIAKKAYPFNLALVVGDDRADIVFEVTATKPWSAAQVKTLTATLKRVVAVKPNNNHSEERTARETKLVADAGFARPLAATLVSDTYAIYVATLTEVQAKHRDVLVGKLQKRLDTVATAVKTELESKDAATRLDVTGLVPIKPLNASWSDPADIVGELTIGSHGDGNVVRAVVYTGAVQIMLFVAPKKPFVEDKVYDKLVKLLEGITADEHITAIEEEDYRLNPR